MAGEPGERDPAAVTESAEVAAAETAAADAAETAVTAAEAAVTATEAATAAEPAGISRAGGKGGNSNRGSSCESEDELA